MRRAILGGTFDPPHVGHLFAAEAAYRQLDVDIVTFIPAGDPWQKADREVTSDHHRWVMTELSVAAVAYFEADRRELDRSGPSYTIDTLESYGDDDVTLVLGSDAAAGLPGWHRPDEVIARARIAVMPRPGASVANVREVVPENRLVVLDTPELLVSGTELRRRAANGQSLRFLVRDAVWDYINDTGLYLPDDPLEL